MNQPIAPHTVAVAVSGGADSLKTLLLMKEQGQDVFALHGVFFSFDDAGREAEACRMRDRLAVCCQDAGVALHIVDLRADFLQLVMRPFVQAYAQGRTPNPCALCNAGIKFGLLLDAAVQRGAKKLATGHYAALLSDIRGEKDSQGMAVCGVSGGAESFPALYQGADPARDQSYFLALVPGMALSKVVFPLADKEKSGVLDDLERHGLAVPQPGESREVCFIDADSYQDVLPAMAQSMGITLPGPGPMLLGDNTCLGTHKGLWRYTEGQRRGLGLGWKEPLHVLGKEPAANVLRLGPRRDMRAKGCVCSGVNLLVSPQRWPERVLVKTRYRECPKEARAWLDMDNAGQVLRIRFMDPDSALAPGQVAALFAPGVFGNDRLRLLAGGIIENVE